MGAGESKAQVVDAAITPVVNVRPSQLINNGPTTLAKAATTAPAASAKPVPGELRYQPLIREPVRKGPFDYAVRGSTLGEGGEESLSGKVLVEQEKKAVD